MNMASEADYTDFVGVLYKNVLYYVLDKVDKKKARNKTMLQHSTTTHFFLRTLINFWPFSG